MERAQVWKLGQLDLLLSVPPIRYMKDVDRLFLKSLLLR